MMEGRGAKAWDGVHVPDAAAGKGAELLQGEWRRGRQRHILSRACGEAASGAWNERRREGEEALLLLLMRMEME
jgi:hypothetical protein